MPIPVACACGAQLKVPEGAAGKMVKCPKCAALIPVPAAPGAPTAAPEAPPPIEAAPAEKACPYCAETIKAAARICPFCKTDLARPGGVRRNPAGDANPRDLKMEGHLRALALWYRIGGLLCAVVGLIMLVVGAGSGRMGGAEVGCIMAVMVGMGALLFVLGHFLGKLSNGVRIACGVLTILGMVMNLLSLAVGAGGGPGGGAAAGGNALGVLFSLGWSSACLWAFFNGRAAAVCTPAYVDNMARTPQLKSATFSSPFFWIPLGFIGLVMLIAVVAGIAAASR